MTITVGTNCSTLRIESELINVLIGTSPSPIAKLELFATVNCCEEEFSTEIKPSDIMGGVYIINPAFFNQTELLDGIYTIKLVASYGTVTSITQVVTEVSCKFVSCNLSCDVVSSDSELAHLFFTALSNTDDCECICEDMCILLEKLLNEINGQCDTVCT